MAQNIEEQLALCWEQNIHIWIAWAEELRTSEDRQGLSAMVQEIWRRERNAMYVKFGALAIYDEAVQKYSANADTADQSTYQLLTKAMREKLDDIDAKWNFWSKVHIAVSNIHGQLEVQLQRDEIAQEIARYAGRKG